jgi:two-component system chemotaxis response regulator CheY
MVGARVFLIIEDNGLVRDALRRLLLPFGEVRTAISLATAISALGQLTRLDGVVLDIVLEDGSGLELLPLLRAHYPKARVLLCTALGNEETINQAFDLDVQYICKPIEIERVRKFARRAVKEGTTKMARTTKSKRDAAIRALIPKALRDFSTKHKLPAAETRIVEAALWAIPADEYAAGRGISKNTYKSQTRSLLQRTKKDTLAAVRAALMRIILARLRD